MHKSIAQSATSENLCVDLSDFLLECSELNKKGGTFFTKEGTVFPSESCPRGTNFTREFCPGGHYFQGDNINCDTGPSRWDATL